MADILRAHRRPVVGLRAVGKIGAAGVTKPRGGTYLASWNCRNESLTNALVMLVSIRGAVLWSQQGAPTAVNAGATATITQTVLIPPSWTVGVYTVTVKMATTDI